MGWEFSINWWSESRCFCEWILKFLALTGAWESGNLHLKIWLRPLILMHCRRGDHSLRVVLSSLPCKAVDFKRRLAAGMWCRMTCGRAGVRIHLLFFFFEFFSSNLQMVQKLILTLKNNSLHSEKSGKSYKNILWISTRRFAPLRGSNLLASHVPGAFAWDNISHNNGVFWKFKNDNCGKYWFNL